jgi:hypothetical protein
VIEKVAAIPQYAPLLAEHRLQGCRAQANRDLGMNGGKLCFQPWAAGRDFRVRGFLVNAPLAPFFELEMLDRVRYVHLCTIDVRRFESTIKHAAGRTDERLPREIFFVAGLLAYKDDASLRTAFTEDCLRGVPVQLASLALLDGAAQFI